MNRTRSRGSHYKRSPWLWGTAHLRLVYNAGLMMPSDPGRADDSEWHDKRQLAWAMYRSSRTE